MGKVKVRRWFPSRPILCPHSVWARQKPHRNQNLGSAALLLRVREEKNGLLSVSSWLGRTNCTVHLREALRGEGRWVTQIMDMYRDLFRISSGSQNERERESSRLSWPLSDSFVCLGTFRAPREAGESERWSGISVSSDTMAFVGNCSPPEWLLLGLVFSVGVASYEVWHKYFDGM